MVDFVSQDFETHAATGWNQQIDDLVANGHLSFAQGQAEKIIHS